MHTGYALDEPTTGLRFEDIRKLLGMPTRLVDICETVIVIEHNVWCDQVSGLVVGARPFRRELL